MRYFLQMGYGMMAMNLELIEEFAAAKQAGVIVWPRTLSRTQVERHAKEVREAGASLLFDPCFYVPNTERQSILDYPYWDGIKFDTVDFTGQEGRDFCKRVIEYQVHTLCVDSVLLPGRYANVRNEEWLEMHRLFAEVGEEYGLYCPIYSTVALGPDVIGDKASLDAIADELVSYPVDGYYVLYRPPNDDYLACDEAFLLSLLQFLLSLSLTERKVIVGYANQQDLLSAAAGVETIASGNYRNVRRFNPDIFEEPEDEERRKATWYYDGRSMCEFKIPQLGIADKFNVRSKFGPSSKYASPLLTSPNPAAHPWGEPDSFRHYLTVHRDQWLSLGNVPRAQRAARVRDLLEQSRKAVVEYRQSKFPLGDRSSEQALSSYVNAIDAFIALEESRLKLL